MAGWVMAVVGGTVGRWTSGLMFKEQYHSRSSWPIFKSFACDACDVPYVCWYGCMVFGPCDQALLLSTNRMKPPS